jgi:hypothetical protein
LHSSDDRLAGQGTVEASPELRNRAESDRGGDAPILVFSVAKIRQDLALWSSQRGARAGREGFRRYHRGERVCTMLHI